MSSQEHNMAVLGQIVKHIPAKLIEKLKVKYRIQTRSFSETSHVVAMLFAQLSHALSLNDICDCLRFHKGYLAQIRDCVPPSRNGLAHANATRNAALAEELFWSVLDEVKSKHPKFISGGRRYPGMPWRFKRTIHVVDSTTIRLIAKCMDWAKHTKQKAAAKMHLDLDLRSFLPNFAIVNRAKDSDPKMAWKLCDPIRAGEIVVFDKPYVDFEHLYHLHRKGVVWVTRSKENMCYEVMGQQLSEEETQQARHMREASIYVGQQPIVSSDNLVRLARKDSFEKYPENLRLVTACVLRDGKPAEMSFITNQLEWSPYSICDLYLARWGIEVFFKEIKQTLQLADFLETTVTQEINTNTSAGRMMLNILMTFAQFEREIIAERIRDKLSSARKKGKYIGGVLPLGYRADSVAMKIEIEPDEARIVRQIFNTFVNTLSVKAVQRKLKCEGITRPVRTSKKGKEITGREISCTVIRKVLQNPIYIGKIRYRGQEYPGEHKGFIPEELFRRAQEGLEGLKRVVRAPSPEVENPFSGILYCGHCRRAMFRAKKSNGKRQYEYYVCSRDSKAAASECPVHRVTANSIDMAVKKAIQSLLLTPTMLAQICGRELIPDDARDELADIDEVWARMFPAERRKLTHTLFKRVLIFPNEVKIIMSGAAAEKMLKEAGVKYKVEHDTGNLVMSIPCQMKQHNNRKVIALVDVKEEPGFRSQIQRALIQAEKGMERIISGKVTTIGEIADRMNVDRSYVARTLALANLAPDIVKLIWEGRQPKGLTLEKLRQGIPDSWEEQRKVFGVV